MNYSNHFRSTSATLSCFQQKALSIWPMLLLILLFSCNDKNAMNDLPEPSPNCDFYVAVSASLFEDGPKDPFTFAQAELTGDCLELTVRYGGGCKEVNFRLVDGGEMGESDPVQRNLRLSLDDTDNCEALISKTISFDLIPLRLPDENQILLNLEGVTETFLYTY